MKASSWLSCRIIVPNLVAAYDASSLRKAARFGFDRFSTIEDVWSIAKSIYDLRPDRIVFLDHSPHPEPVIRALAAIYGNKKLPELFFHIYGDFTYHSPYWHSVSEILENVPVRFICASHRQVQLVSKFLAQPDKHLSLCHFPVNKEVFNFDPKARQNTRKKLGLEADEHVLLYTGRLSMQKNVVSLLRRSIQFFLQTNQKFKILLAGDYDDVAAPFFGIKRRPGSYFHWVDFNLDLFPAYVKENIKFLGHVEGAELAALYSAADVFTSLSLHHDEDFGMSPAEALCSGLRCLLSNWGGYASFKRDESSCEFVSVNITPRGLVLPPSEFRAGMRKLLVPEDLNERKLRAKKFQEIYSIQNATRLLEQIHAEPVNKFEGFTWLLDRHQEVSKKPIPFADGPVKNSFYEEIYEAYARDL